MTNDLVSTTTANLIQYKSLLSGFALVAYGLFQFVMGDSVHGSTSLIGGLVALGLYHDNITSGPTVTPASPTPSA